MADFKLADQIVSGNEGGFTKNPKDPGNWTGGKVGLGMLVGTNFGIAAPTYADYLGHTPTEAEVRNMKPEVARLIRRNEYWTTILGDFIQNQQVATFLYDTIIQHWDEAFTFTRRALNYLKIKVDGQPVNEKRCYFNAKIIAAINSANQQKLFETVKAYRINYYISLNNPTMIKGWINRMDSFQFVA